MWTVVGTVCEWQCVDGGEQWARYTANAVDSPTSVPQATKDLKRASLSLSSSNICNVKKEGKERKEGRNGGREEERR